MSLDNLDKRRFLEVLEDWSSHRVYYAQAVADKLTACGLEAVAMDDGKAVLIEGVRVEVVRPEWGLPGGIAAVRAERGLRAVARHAAGIPDDRQGILVPGCRRQAPAALVPGNGQQQLAASADD
jgi:hypothetical protein